MLIVRFKLLDPEDENSAKELKNYIDVLIVAGFIPFDLDFTVKKIEDYLYLNVVFPEKIKEVIKDLIPKQVMTLGYEDF